MDSNKIFFQFTAAAAVLALIFLISNPQILSGPTGLQTGACGAETLSSGTNGEVRSKIQDGGTESPCAMNACGAGMVEAGIFADKYRAASDSYQKFTYYKICVKGTSANFKTCTSSAINDEGTLCVPAACGAGETDLGTPADIRNYDGGTGRWDEVSYRLCVAGIDAGSMQWGEQGGSAPTPAACAAGQDSSGLFGEIHFNEGGQYRAWRLCIKYTAPATSSSTTTTTEPPTTSSSSTTPPTTSPGGATSSSTTTPPTTSPGGTSSSSTTTPPTTSAGATTTTTGGSTTTTSSSGAATSPTTTTLSGETATTEPEVQMEKSVSEHDALSAIEEANTTIYSSSSSKNVSDALSLYSKAIDSYNNQDYFNAKAFALQAKLSIKDYEGQKPSDSGNILFISIGAIVLLALIAGVAYYFVKMKPKGASGQPKPSAPSTTPSKKL